VEFSDDLDEDLARRDFTINAVAWHPIRDVIRDPFGGREDMERRVLRTVGNPRERFAEDYLRVLRALRFAGGFRMRIEAETWKALTSAVKHLALLSAERLREELERILSADALPSRSLALYAASGAAALLYPELDATVECPRSPVGEWFSHSLRTVDRLSHERPTLRWAALFQALGEPGSGSVGDGDRSGVDRATLRAAAILERLRASNAKIREVAELAGVAAHPPDPSAPDAELRRWLSRTGRGSLRPVLRIWFAARRADEAAGLGGGEAGRGRLVELALRLRAIARSGAPLRIEELAFDGRDLIALGYSPGPHFGEVLRSLLEVVLTDPSRNRKEALREEAVGWLEARGIAPRASR
jgi:tRNA nucleotidyltransferase/poly(A) polymerase